MTSDSPPDDTMADALERVESARAAVVDGARPGAVARQHGRGRLTARERIARLCDPGSFVELGSLVEPLRDTDLNRDVVAPADGIVTVNSRQAYDIRPVIDQIVDVDSGFELKPTHARNVVTTLARLGGRPVGIIANQPRHLAGTLDAKACEKAARFIALCDAFGLALIYLIDVPGFLVGPSAEATALGKRSARLLFELGCATVPRFSVVLRKGYGLSFCAMNGGRTSFEADLCVAWPTAEICAMSIEGAVDVAYRKTYQDADDPDQARRQLIDDMRDRVTALRAAHRFGIDEIIDPRHTRHVLATSLGHLPLRRPHRQIPKIRAIPPI